MALQQQTNMKYDFVNITTVKVSVIEGKELRVLWSMQYSSVLLQLWWWNKQLNQMHAIQKGTANQEHTTLNKNDNFGPIKH